MIKRSLWVQRITDSWRARSIVWLSGVRRVGKTVLSKQVPGIAYFNCDLPSTQRQLADAEIFFSQRDAASPVVLDEVHRLPDPSLVLKVAADEYPHHRILATGSSTLEATNKFRDSLAGRKRQLHLPPVLWQECRTSFEIADLDRRLLRGGLPESLLAQAPDGDFFEEWIDSFYARDVQELFGVRNRNGFLNLLKLLVLRSGGQLEISDLAKEAAISRPTVMSHIDAMEIAHAVTRIPPYHGGGHREIVRRPKVYAFDTGMVAHVRGWEKIRDTDRGHLWEHLVLDELRVAFPPRTIHYWRDNSGREVDFVIERKPGVADTAEAKINPDAFDPANLAAFRDLHPQGADHLVCPFVDEPYCIERRGRVITVCGVEHFARLNGN
ncbi:MAG: ATP-binding protein [Kiritimatiellae bacterium]|nr:ATP-binding protein [Kiritimatiellia bacterium]